MPSPTDFSAVDEVLNSRDTVSVGPKGTYATSQNDAVKLALEVVKNIFPDYLKTGASVTAGSTRNFGSIADYQLLGHSIRLDPTKMAGRISPSTSQYFPKDSKGNLDASKKETQVNFTTDDVMTNVNTILHEFYHAKSGGGWSSGKDRAKAEKQFNITDEIKTAVNKIAGDDTYNIGSRLYSMKEKYLDIEEFMANAAPLLDMRDRSIMPQGGPLREKLSTVEKIMAQFPQMAQFIENSRQPDVPSLKSGIPDPGTLGALIESIFGPPGKTEKKK